MTPSTQTALTSGDAAMRTCNACIHRLPCLARANLERLVRDYKLLAMDRHEQAENGCTASADDLRAALAGSCVVFVCEGEG